MQSEPKACKIGLLEQCKERCIHLNVGDVAEGMEGSSKSLFVDCGCQVANVDSHNRCCQVDWTTLHVDLTFMSESSESGQMSIMTCSSYGC